MHRFVSYSIRTFNKSPIVLTVTYRLSSNIVTNELIPLLSCTAVNFEFLNPGCIKQVFLKNTAVNIFTSPFHGRGKYCSN